MKKVSVVILNFKVKDELLKCLDSVKRSDYDSLEIIVVDNSSGDGLEEELKTSLNIEFIQTGKNLGYSGGNNVGIKAAIKNHADYILVLNPDTLVKKDTISKMVKGLEKYDAGVVCPKIYFEDGKTIWYAGKDFDKLNVLGKHRGLDQQDKGQFDQEVETEANGAAMLVKQEVFEKVGLFDERFFLYLEDSDFSLRVKESGFKIMYIPSAVVIHKNAKSTGLGSSLQDYFITRNRMLFASKYLPFRTRFALFREALRNIGNPARRLALFDFLLGKFGKGSYIHD